MSKKEKRIPPQSGLGHWMHLLWKSPVGTVGFIILVVVLLSTIFAGAITPWDPAKIDVVQKLIPPSWCKGGVPEHLLGTDSLGRDVFARCLYGARISLLVGICSVVVAGIIGTVLGIMFLGNWLRDVLDPKNQGIR